MMRQINYLNFPYSNFIKLLDTCTQNDFLDFYHWHNFFFTKQIIFVNGTTMRYQLDIKTTDSTHCEYPRDLLQVICHNQSSVKLLIIQGRPGTPEFFARGVKFKKRALFYVEKALPTKPNVGSHVAI